MLLYGRYVSSGIDTNYHYIWRYLSLAADPAAAFDNFQFWFRYWFR